MSDKTFRPWEPDQQMLFPPSVRDFVPEGHLAHFVRDVVREDLDLSSIFARYVELRGQPPYHPALMTSLLLYAYSRGIYSSRRIERSCEERVDFMALTGGEKPDHSTICQFRSDHREALSALFVQVLALCRDAGMVNLGHVSLDGTKMKANASRHAAMSYARMKKREPELAKLVAEWMEAARSADEEEDEEHGPGRRGDELPKHVREKLKKLLKMREAMAKLESEAEEEAARVAKEREEKEKELGRKLGGPKPRALSGEPEDKAQSNFTDPESRIMKTKDGYEQGYNCQAGVEAGSQVIVCHDVTAKQNDHDELVPMVDQIEENTGRLPDEVSADTGYCSEENLEALLAREIRGYIATGRQKHGTASPTDHAEKRHGPLTKAMRARLRQGGWRSRYRLRKHTVEPVFGQIKEDRGFRQFLRRGLENVRGEWALICTVHNLLKLAAVRSAAGS
jgi:transposase